MSMCVSEHLVFVEQLLGAAQRAPPLFSSDGGQSVPQPGHLLLLISVELEQNLPGLQGFPATLQGLRQAVVPEWGGGITEVNAEAAQLV